MDLKLNSSDNEKDKIENLVETKTFEEAENRKILSEDVGEKTPEEAANHDNLSEDLVGEKSFEESKNHKVTVGKKTIEEAENHDIVSEDMVREKTFVGEKNLEEAKNQEILDEDIDGEKILEKVKNLDILSVNIANEKTFDGAENPNILSVRIVGEETFGEGKNQEILSENIVFEKIIEEAENHAILSKDIVGEKTLEKAENHDILSDFKEENIFGEKTLEKAENHDILSDFKEEIQNDNGKVVEQKQSVEEKYFIENNNIKEAQIIDFLNNIKDIIETARYSGSENILCDEIDQDKIAKDAEINSKVFGEKQFVEVQITKPAIKNILYDISEEDEMNDSTEDSIQSIEIQEYNSSPKNKNSNWYVEDERVLKQILKLSSANEVESKDLNLGLDLMFSNDNDQDEVIGDYVNVNKTSLNQSLDDLPKVEKLFGTMEIISLQEHNVDSLHMNSIELETNDKQNDHDDEMPIVPDFEIDYDNIFGNISELSSIEKHLQLLYRPFTCVVDINCQCSLFELAILLDDARYESEKYSALYLRLRDPSADIRIFEGGKITSSALTANSARMALLKVMRMLDKLGYKTDITYFNKNIVHASFCLPFKLDLEMLSEMHSGQVSGNRKVRPFITYKIANTSLRFAVFPNGYVLVLHSKGHSETRAAIAGFLPILVQFKNGYLTKSEKYGSLGGDVSFKLLWERKLEEDVEGVLLYS